jgi:undecaprenyl-diphosphatase
MSPLQAAVLGAVQGLTEFLPISSSAHLYLVPRLLGWPYAGMAFDVALHWGTLAALVAAFWGDWVALGRGALSGPADERRTARMSLLKIAVASVPAAVIGLLLQDLEVRLRAPLIQAATLAGFGFLLWWVDRASPRGEATRDPGWRTCLVMGAAQSLSLVPGVSRSGITITSGRAAGLDRVSAARFSFLLATPITFGAGVLEMHHLHGLSAGSVAIGITTAAVVGFLAIRGLIRWLGRAGFGVFFAYRLALAAWVLLSLGR